MAIMVSVLVFRLIVLEQMGFSFQYKRADVHEDRETQRFREWGEIDRCIVIERCIYREV